MLLVKMSVPSPAALDEESSRLRERSINLLRSQIFPRQRFDLLECGKHPRLVTFANLEGPEFVGKVEAVGIDGMVMFKASSKAVDL